MRLDINYAVFKKYLPFLNSLPPANKVWGKVLFSQVCVMCHYFCPRGGGVSCPFITCHMTGVLPPAGVLHRGGFASSGVYLHPGWGVGGLADPLIVYYGILECILLVKLILVLYNTS